MIMRHKVFGKKLKRDIKERKALFKNLIVSFISVGKIKTSLAKAKAVQRLIEKLVTKVKDGEEAALRQVSSFLTRKDVSNKLVDEIAPRFKNISGGYTRVRRISQRLGDAAQEAILEWSVAADEQKTGRKLRSEPDRPKEAKKEKKAKK